MPGTPEPSADAVSPELVLVDPELAERRRPIELTGSWTPAVHSAAIRARSRRAPAPLRVYTTELAQIPRIVVERLPARPRRRLLVALATVAAAGGGIAAAALVLRRDEPASHGRPKALAPAPPVTAGVSPAETIVHVPKRKTTTATSRVRKTPAPVAPLRRRPTLLRWKRVRFATFYHVTLGREGARQLDLWTPRTTLSLRLLRDGRGLSAGRYQWSVRPGYGNLRFRKVPGRTFYGPVVKRGVLVVPVGR